MSFDLFFSHRSTQKERIRPLVEALDKAGLSVFLDENDHDVAAPITQDIEDKLLDSRSLLAWISDDYAQSRPCQWELTLALIGADPKQRGAQIIPVTPNGDVEAIPTKLLKDLTVLDQNEALTDPAAFAAKLKARLDAAADRPVFGAQASALPTWNIGDDRYQQSGFVGRLTELWAIDDALQAPAEVGAPITALVLGQVTGLGGVGKSALAYEYANRYGRRYPGGIFRLSAGGDAETAPPEALAARALGAVVDALGLVVEKPTLANLRGALAYHIGKDQPYLWLIDDLPSVDATELMRWIEAPTAAGVTLITSRGRPLGLRGTTIEVDVLPLLDAVAILRRYRPDASDAALEAIARFLGGHALALTLAAHALQFAAPETYLIDLQQDGLAALDEIAASLGQSLPPHHRDGIARAFAYSLARVTEDDSRDTLTFLASLAAAPVPTSFIRQVLERRPTGALSRLHALGLVQTGRDAVSLHALLAEAARSRSEASQIAHLREAAWGRIDPLLQAIQARPAERPTLTPLLPHAEHLAEGFLARGRDAPLWDLGMTFNHAGDIAAAPPIWRRLVEWHTEHLDSGLENPKTLACMANLARTLYAQGDLSEARALQEKVLALQYEVLGPKHPNTLTSMNNLASMLSAQGDLSSSRTLQAYVLELQREGQGPEYSGTLASMNNLAATLKAQGDLAGARATQEEVLTLQRKLLGPDHPNTLASIGNLALTLQAQGDLAGAQKLQEEVLALYQKLLGPEHPDTIISMGNLAETLRARGGLSKARLLQEHVLILHQKILGKEHFETIASMNNLSLTLMEQGDLDGARIMGEESLCLHLKVLGPEHPDTLQSMNNLATMLLAQGDLVYARALQEEALALRRKVLGLEHPDTITSMGNLAAMLQEQGDLTGVQALQEEVYALRHKLLGPEHPDTIISMGNLAGALAAQGDLAGARALLEKVLALQRKLLGPEHPNTLTCLNNLAAMLHAQNDLSGARVLQEEVLALRRKLLGLEHPSTIISLSWLAATSNALGDRTSARKLVAEAVPAARKVWGDQHPHTQSILAFAHQLGLNL